MKKWDLAVLTKSALFFYLEKKFIQENSTEKKLFNKLEWTKFAGLIINSKISDTILEFMNEIGLIEISPEKMIVYGSFRTIQGIFSFETRIFSKGSLRNLLSLLKMDPVLIESLITKAYETKDLKHIVEFLLTFESRLD